MVATFRLRQQPEDIILKFDHEKHEEFLPGQETLFYMLQAIDQTSQTQLKSKTLGTPNVDSKQPSVNYVAVNKVLLYFQQELEIEPMLASWELVIRIYASLGEFSAALQVLQKLSMREPLRVSTYNSLLDGIRLTKDFGVAKRVVSTMQGQQIALTNLTVKILYQTVQTIEDYNFVKDTYESTLRDSQRGTGARQMFYLLTN